MRVLGFAGVVALSLAVALGLVRVMAQEENTEKATMLILVERADSVTTVDLGESGTSAGDLIIWGPNPLYDEANESDTGATTQGSCHVLDSSGVALCVETIRFADGSTIEIQGVQAAGSEPSARTIVGGSGAYLGVIGTVQVAPSDDLTLWTKQLEIVR